MQYYVVDAFTDQLFHGNPAGVCLVDTWPSDELMLNIAKENRFSETAFAIKNDDSHYQLRWFTPGGEIDLCGHATLAAAFIIFRQDPPQDTDTLGFATQSGELRVTQKGDLYEMAFLSYDLKPVPVTDEMTAAFGAQPVEAYLGRDLLAVFDDPKTVRQMEPDQEKMAGLEGLLQNVTAPGDEDFDAVSRSFAPKLAVDEDPVCGSGHCHIVPYWAKRLGKNDIKAFQASDRTGVLYCEYDGDTTKLAGQAVLYAEGEIKI
ncbi:PhzF family phenazine biosynthesis protein [Leuconostocaceae bacterium ESL0723]|nr:PhzF family phenazine biosynthesis protein [Leuconostocaceae bacterium ESL0723]